MGLHRRNSQRRYEHKHKKLPVRLVICNNNNKRLNELKQLIGLCFSALEVCMDRTQVTGWEDLLLQYRDETVYMGEAR